MRGQHAGPKTPALPWQSDTRGPVPEGISYYLPQAPLAHADPTSKLHDTGAQGHSVYPGASAPSRQIDLPSLWQLAIDGITNHATRPLP